MKRNRLKQSSKWTKTQKRTAVSRVNRLVKEGLTMNAATITVAAEVGAHKGTIAYWVRTFSKSTPVRTTKTTTTSVKSSGKSNSTITGLEHMKGQLGAVFTSLVNKDGQFTNKDAGAISQVSSNILGTCKQILLEKKYNGIIRKAKRLTK
jgi:transposase-like protein